MCLCVNGVKNGMCVYVPKGMLRSVSLKICDISQSRLAILSLERVQELSLFSSLKPYITTLPPTCGTTNNSTQLWADFMSLETRNEAAFEIQEMVKRKDEFEIVTFIDNQ